MATRRSVLAGGATGATLTLLAPFARLATAATNPDSRFVLVILRGGLDGLAAVAPYAEPAYAQLRGPLALSAPGTDNGALDLDGTFGLHPALANLHAMYRAREALVLHAAATPYRERSHFDAQDYMETGTPDQKGTRDGWLNRYLALKGTCEAGCAHGAKPSPFRAVSMTQQTPRILEGPSATIAMNSLDEFSVRTTGPAADRLEALYRTGSADVVHAAGGEMFEAVKILRAAKELFLADRYAGVSLERVAERAGVSRQTVYNRFGSKEAVFREMVRDHWAAFAAFAEQDRRPAGDGEDGEELELRKKQFGRIPCVSPNPHKPLTSTDILSIVLWKPPSKSSSPTSCATRSAPSSPRATCSRTASAA